MIEYVVDRKKSSPEEVAEFENWRGRDRACQYVALENKFLDGEISAQDFLKAAKRIGYADEARREIKLNRI